MFQLNLLLQRHVQLLITLFEDEPVAFARLILDRTTGVVPDEQVVDAAGICTQYKAVRIPVNFSHLFVPGMGGAKLSLTAYREVIELDFVGAQVDTVVIQGIVTK